MNISLDYLIIERTNKIKKLIDLLESHPLKSINFFIFTYQPDFLYKFIYQKFQFEITVLNLKEKTKLQWLQDAQINLHFSDNYTESNELRKIRKTTIIYCPL